MRGDPDQNLTQFIATQQCVAIREQLKMSLLIEYERRISRYIKRFTLLLSICVMFVSAAQFVLPSKAEGTMRVVSVMFAGGVAAVAQIDRYLKPEKRRGRAEARIARIKDIRSLLDRSATSSAELSAEAEDIIRRQLEMMIGSDSDIELPGAVRVAYENICVRHSLDNDLDDVRQNVAALVRVNNVVLSRANSADETVIDIMPHVPPVVPPHVPPHVPLALPPHVPPVVPPHVPVVPVVPPAAQETPDSMAAMLARLTSTLPSGSV